jgi:hypothetical protein
MELFKGISCGVVEFVSGGIGLCEELSGGLSEVLLALFEEWCEDFFEVWWGGEWWICGVAAFCHESEDAFFFGGIESGVDQAEE